MSGFFFFFLEGWLIINAIDNRRSWMREVGDIVIIHILCKHNVETNILVNFAFHDDCPENNFNSPMIQVRRVIREDCLGVTLLKRVM